MSASHPHGNEAVGATPIVIVTGPPASGKTTLARAIAQEARLPLLAKDELKEILYDTLGTGDLAWSRRLGIATYPLLFHLARAELRAGRSFVLEANFAAEEARGELERVGRDHRFRALQLVCRAEPDVLVARYLARSALRHRGHLDDERAEEVREAAGRSHVLGLVGETVDIDTTDLGAMDVGAIVERACAWTQP